MRARGWIAISAACLAVTAGGALPSTSQAGTDISPGLFQKLSTGVALIRTYGCGGVPISQGTGFLVGDSVVMTARHVLKGACKVRVMVGGDRFTSERWVSCGPGVALPRGPRMSPR